MGIISAARRASLGLFVPGRGFLRAFGSAAQQSGAMKKGALHSAHDTPRQPQPHRRERSDDPIQRPGYQGPMGAAAETQSRSHGSQPGGAPIGVSRHSGSQSAQSDPKPSGTHGEHGLRDEQDRLPAGPAGRVSEST
ncbi:hypothetical protein H696_03212 [Fonticula alba]|uniref:Uncharacterized protein n=1 Tax=Fonticula alba TaxID=691883 RepID=A0A058Z9A0_FONAL|nr:hypothetical protein H696_03212 [Fonticula alba]KCV70855.1 hypothetical protein H696_03212 [Fonticula alba]|eukprot:XP_009495371.1 hypothetical protein H696_03212 [Fonticula alba]